jgi:hypothetical protein
MTTYELTGKFVAEGALACRGGRIFAAFKRPGEQRNTLHEVKLTQPLQLVIIGVTPGAYYKDGDCSLAFDDVTGELWMYNTCSPNPSTGGDARPILWKTGIVIAPGGGGTTDSVARQQIAAVRSHLRNTP